MDEIYQNRLDDYTLNTAELSRAILSDDFYKAGQAAAEQFEQRKLDATAVICFNDEVAVGFYHRIVQFGYHIPDDISVTGIDGLVIGEYMNPALTSMDLNPFKHGMQCAKVLLDMLQGGKPGYKHRIDFSLVERESVGSPQVKR
jgi:DNA-binding LacI/PurR family transcriptional regulator